MFCSKCGTQIDENARFCYKCGAMVEGSVEGKKPDASSIKVVTMRCNACGGVLQGNAANPIVSCPFCGSQKMILESDPVKIQRIISDTEKEIALDQKKKEYDIELMKLEKREKEKSILRKISLVAVGITFVTAIIAFFINDTDAQDKLFVIGGVPFLIAMVCFIISINDANDTTNKITIPTAVFTYLTKRYDNIENLLIGAGFENVSSVPLHDMGKITIFKEGNVASIRFDGKDITQVKGMAAPPDAKVIISYHSR